MIIDKKYIDRLKRKFKKRVLHNKKIRQKNSAIWRLKNPKKVEVYKIVFHGVRNGTLKKQVCFCGNLKVEAHHEDYSKPLMIVWLCKKHHVQADKKRRKSNK